MKQSKLTAAFKWTYRLVLLGLLVAIALSAFAYWQLSGSLAQLDGDVEHPALLDSVVVERDALGIPLILAEERSDTAFALGYLHAQERFFQMDLLRRNSAGELSALFGARALAHDQPLRVHQFRHRADAALAALPETDRAILRAYVEGVNHGLTALRSKPFEYHLLGTTPEPWTAADTLLAIYSMYLDLQPNRNEQEVSRGIMRDVLPADWFAFVLPDGGEWDAPIHGDSMTFNAALPERPLASFADRSLSSSSHEEPVWAYEDAVQYGSNSWSAGGDHTEHGGGLLANDMHLGLNVPNIWYRATWQVPGADRRISGATLPGTPAMVVGSNEHIAWGFTNSNGDYHDTVILQTRPDPETGAAEGEYLTPAGWQPFERAVETIAVNGEDPVEVAVRLTQWGPVIGRDHERRLLAMRWTAHDPEGVNLAAMALERASTVEEALPLAARAGIPGQNLLVVDRDGNQAWSILGPLPVRQGEGFDGREPADWSDGARGWSGYLAAEDYPVVLNPEAGRLWTANARIVSDDLLATVGSARYSLGARQQQIRDALLADATHTEADFLALQLDDRALFLTRWQALLAAVLTELEAAQPGEDWAEMAELVADWSARAEPDDVGYHLVKRFRERVINQTVGQVHRYVKTQAGSVFRPGAVSQKLEYAAWALVSEQPERHLPAGYRDWTQFLQTMAAEVRTSLTEDGVTLREQTWGRVNTLNIRHPMADSVPVFGRFLGMPAVPMPGDTFMPRVQTPNVGASQRLVVAPGQESSGVFHMATGQSAHPLSPFYGQGHRAWVTGDSSPLLPGEPVYRLRFAPR